MAPRYGGSTSLQAPSAMPTNHTTPSRTGPPRNCITTVPPVRRAPPAGRGSTSSAYTTGGPTWERSHGLCIGTVVTVLAEKLQGRGEYVRGPVVPPWRRLAIGDGARAAEIQPAPLDRRAIRRHD